jgi:hypothetical protein
MRWPAVADEIGQTERAEMLKFPLTKEQEKELAKQQANFLAGSSKMPYLHSLASAHEAMLRQCEARGLSRQQAEDYLAQHAAKLKKSK